MLGTAGALGAHLPPALLNTSPTQPEQLWLRAGAMAQPTELAGGPRGCPGPCWEADPARLSPRNSPLATGSSLLSSNPACISPGLGWVSILSTGPRDPSLPPQGRSLSFPQRPGPGLEPQQGGHAPWCSKGLMGNSRWGTLPRAGAVLCGSEAKEGLWYPHAGHCLPVFGTLSCTPTQV